jgi:CBS domain-containing protein/K+/H+ antiporter YhaU regulatory subunit KhtT
VMETDAETINARTSFRGLVDLTVNSPHASFFVVDQSDRLMGAISVHDIRKLIYESDELEPIVVAHDLMNPVRHVFTPNDTLDTVMAAFGDMNIEELPVVDDKTEQRFIGVVSKSNVIEAYNRAIFKKDMITSMSGYLGSLSESKRVKMANGQELVEIEIPGEFVGQTLQKLQLRRRFGAEVLLIKENYNHETKDWGHVMTPKADYRFKLGDSILLMGSQDSIDAISKMG